MNKPTGLLGDALDQLGSIGKGVGQSIASTPKDLAKTAAVQVGLPAREEREKNGPAKSPEAKKANGFATDEARKEYLKGLYGIESSKQQASQGASTPKIEKAPKTPQEVLQIKQKQNELGQLQQQHATSYFQPTFNRPKPQDERPAEKVEREKQQDEKEKLFEKKKKEEKPIAVQMAEQKTERFRGAAG